MSIAELYRKLKQILNYSNEALISKGLNPVNSLNELFLEINNKINRLPYLASRSIIKASENDFYNITNVGDYAFFNCNNLKSVTIPNNIITIGNSAFYNCSNLTNVIIGDDTASIKNYAFNHCESLTDITIPNSVTNIGLGAFKWCKNLKSITIPFIGSSRTANEQPDATFGYIFDYMSTSHDDRVIQFYSDNVAHFKYYFIPSSICSVTITDTEIIPYGAFYNCGNITNIELPSNLTSISTKAFYRCSKLTNITIPDKVVSIGRDAFGSCTEMSDIYLKPVIPPTLGATNAIPSGTTIHVPVGSGEAYKSATNWSNHAKYIVEDIVIE